MSKQTEKILRSVKRSLDRVGATIRDYKSEVDCIHLVTNKGHVRIYWDGDVTANFALA